MKEAGEGLKDPVPEIPLSVGNDLVESAEPNGWPTSGSAFHWPHTGLGPFPSGGFLRDAMSDHSAGAWC